MPVSKGELFANLGPPDTLEGRLIDSALHKTVFTVTVNKWVGDDQLIEKELTLTLSVAMIIPHGDGNDNVVIFADVCEGLIDWIRVRIEKNPENNHLILIVNENEFNRLVFLDQIRGTEPAD